MKKFICSLTVCLMVYTLQMTAQTPKYHSDELIPVAELGNYKAIGVSVSSNNRLFVSFPNLGGAYQYGLTEIINGRAIPFPNMDWNKVKGNYDKHFLSVQDLYIDAHDYLWVLDSKPASGGSIFANNGERNPTKGSFKLLKINLKTDQVEQIYNFDDLDKTKSGLNDVRVDVEKNMAYLSDPGQAAIVILNLADGKTRTVLSNHNSTTADPNIILTYEGKEMRNKDGKAFQSNVNGIALTKDFKYFYYKPINKKNLYRIETKYLIDASLTEKQLESKIENLGETVITHGLIADAKGNIYLTSSTDYSIKYISTDGKTHTLVQDSRLIWPDSLGIGTDGYLYFSCAQINRDAQWNSGLSKVELPYSIYKVKLP